MSSSPCKEVLCLPQLLLWLDNSKSLLAVESVCKSVRNYLVNKKESGKCWKRILHQSITKDSNNNKSAVVMSQAMLANINYHDARAAFLTASIWKKATTSSAKPLIVLPADTNTNTLFAEEIPMASAIPQASMPILASLPHVLPESILHGPHLIHRTSKITHLTDAEQTVYSLQVPQDAHPIVFTHPKFPDHAVYMTSTSTASASKSVSVLDLVQKQTVFQSSTLSDNISDTRGVWDLLFALKRVSLGYADLMAWRLTKGDVEGTVSLKGVGMCRIKTLCFSLAGVDVSGNCVVTTRVEEPLEIEKMAAGNNNNTGVSAKAPPSVEDMDPMAVLRAMRELSLRGDNERKRVESSLSARLLATPSSSSSSSSTTTTTTSQPAPTPTHQMVFELHDTTQSSLPVVHTLRIPLSEPTSSPQPPAAPASTPGLCVVTSTHAFLTLRKAHPTLYVFDLTSTSTTPTLTLPLSGVLKTTGATNRPEVVVRMEAVVSPIDGGVCLGVVLGTSGDAVLVVDAVARTVRRWERKSAASYAGVFCVIAGGDDGAGESGGDGLRVVFKHLPKKGKGKGSDRL